MWAIEFIPQFDSQHSMWILNLTTYSFVCLFIYPLGLFHWCDVTCNPYISLCDRFLSDINIKIQIFYVHGGYK